MADKDIVKALECCNTQNCADCPLYNGNSFSEKCKAICLKEVASLINRQQAEIEKLQNLECFKKIIFRRMHTNYKTGLSWEFPTEEAYNEAFEKEVEKLYDIATATVEAIKEFAKAIIDKIDGGLITHSSDIVDFTADYLKNGR